MCCPAKPRARELAPGEGPTTTTGRFTYDRLSKIRWSPRATVAHGIQPSRELKPGNPLTLTVIRNESVVMRLDGTQSVHGCPSTVDLFGINFFREYRCRHSPFDERRPILRSSHRGHVARMCRKLFSFSGRSPDVSVEGVASGSSWTWRWC